MGERTIKSEFKLSSYQQILSFVQILSWERVKEPEYASFGKTKIITWTTVRHKLNVAEPLRHWHPPKCSKTSRLIVFFFFNVHGSVHRNNIVVYNSNKMHMSQNLFYLTTATHISGVTITHLQEHKATVTTASGNCYTVLLSAAIVEELELIWVCCGWRKPPTCGGACSVYGGGECTGFW